MTRHSALVTAQENVAENSKYLKRTDIFQINIFNSQYGIQVTIRFAFVFNDPHFRLKNRIFSKIFIN